jgi:sporulation protein YunB
LNKIFGNEVHLYKILTYIINTCKEVKSLLRKMGGNRIGKKIKINNSLLIMLIFIFMAFFPLYIFEKNLKPTIKAVAESKANLIATEAINKTIYEDILKNIEYQDLVEIHKDTENKITLIQANSIQMSRLISETNLKIKDALNSLNGEVFEIPLGQALGSYLFAAYGPAIKVKILPIGEIAVKLQQDFHEAGINQTRHILYLDIYVSVKVVVPMATEKITVATKTPIAETIIVGSVPNTVVEIEGIDGILNGSLYGR